MGPPIARKPALGSSVELVSIDGAVLDMQPNGSIVSLRQVLPNCIEPPGFGEPGGAGACSVSTPQMAISGAQLVVGTPNTAGLRMAKEGQQR